jgi:aquaglyceroporin related protein
VNPAVTIGLTLFRRFPLRKLPIYWFLQTLAFFVGSAIIYAFHASKLDELENNSPSENKPNHGTIFYHLPEPDVSLAGMFFAEVIGTALLLAVLCAINDRHNNGDMGALMPLIFGLSLTAILMALGRYSRVVLFSM